ncbi:MAG TPA: outer membrane protein assembly factor BamB [Burkholderiales bacterium]|nr:outer membrane protein assembly factor BamB [Burkholderiales bacterium]
MNVAGRSNFARMRACFGMLAIGLLAAACGGSPTVKPAELVKFKPTARAKVVWHSSVGEADVYIFTPAVYEGAVYAAGADGRLSRFDAASGKRMWRVKTKEELSGGVGADAGVVVVGSRKGAVLAYDVNGKPLWKSQVSSEVLMAPRAAQGLVVVRSGDGKIFALDAKDGKQRWEYRFTLPPLLLRSDSGVTIVKGTVLAGLSAGRVVALNLTDGSVLWESTLAQPKGANELERITDIGASAVIAGDQACAVAYQGRVGCYEVARGTLLWSRDASAYVGLEPDPITVYMSDTRSSVLALDRNTGATIWKQEKLFARELSAPVEVGLYVALGDFEGYLHFLDRDTGNFAVRLSTDGSGIRARPIRIGQNVLVQTLDGGVYLVSVKTL